MAGGLSGKTVVITGGGTGIGAGVALGLAQQGAQVILGGRREDKLREVAEQFTGEPSIAVHALDVADRASVETFFNWVNQDFGTVDILVNSAGVNTPKRSMADLAPEEWDRLLTINATGAFNCMKAVLPAMREKKDGLIINISSIAGKRAVLLGGVAYNASKFAMSALGTSTALEDGKNGIRVSNVYPGEVDTPILLNRPVPVSQEHRDRILQPEDLAAAVVMIALLPPRAHIPELIIKPTTQDYA